MKRTLIVSLLTVLAIVSLLIPTPSIAQSMSTVQKGTPLNAGETPLTGILTATNTLSVGAVNAVRCPALPAGTVAIEVISVAAFNYGSSSVGAASAGTFLGVAANTSKTFKIYPNTVQPDLWFVTQIPGATATLNIFSHVQK